MDWWQNILVILASIVAGLLVGYLLGYIIVTRILRKPFSIKWNVTQKWKVAKQQSDKQMKIEVEKAGEVKRAEEGMEKETTVVEEPLKSTASDLIEEAENNYKIANEHSIEKLLSFQTSVWDGKKDEVHKLPINLQDDLTQAYLDMRLANSVVWLCTELGRKSHNLDKNYLALCANIAVRLNRIIPLLKGPIE